MWRCIIFRWIEINNYFGSLKRIRVHNGNKCGDNVAQEFSTRNENEIDQNSTYKVSKKKSKRTKTAEQNEKYELNYARFSSREVTDIIQDEVYTENAAGEQVWDNNKTFFFEHDENGQEYLVTGRFRNSRHNYPRFEEIGRHEMFKVPDFQSSIDSVVEFDVSDQQTVAGRNLSVNNTGTFRKGYQARGLHIGHNVIEETYSLSKSWFGWW